MRYGLDTSVVLRLLTGEPKALAEVAGARVAGLLGRGNGVEVSDLVVAESYFALQHAYGMTKSNAVAAIDELLRASGITAAGAAVAVLATPALGSARPGFVDRIIHASYRQRGGRMLTCERAAARLEGVEVLRA